MSFIRKTLTYITIVNVAALPVLLMFRIPLKYAFSLIFVYEGFFTLAFGGLFILCTYVYREDSIPCRYGARTGWFNFKKFSRLTSEERQRYRQEGKILMIIGLLLWLATTILLLSNV
jgi:hypothetical protein